jgi:hypothetical protein
MDRHIADALERGARLVSGGARAEGVPTRLYYQPTVLDGVTEDMLVAREETFGPIVPVTAVRDEAEVLRIVNSSPTGCWRRVDAGPGARPALRRVRAYRLCQHKRLYEPLGEPPPFGGHAGARSGVGRVGGRYRWRPSPSSRPSSSAWSSVPGGVAASFLPPRRHLFWGWMTSRPQLGSGIHGLGGLRDERATGTPPGAYVLQVPPPLVFFSGFDQ